MLRPADTPTHPQDNEFSRPASTAASSRGTPRGGRFDTSGGTRSAVALERSERHARTGSRFERDPAKAQRGGEEWLDAARRACHGLADHTTLDSFVADTDARETAFRIIRNAREQEIPLPRAAQWLDYRGEPVAPSDLRPGDIAITMTRGDHHELYSIQAPTGHDTLSRDDHLRRLRRGDPHPE